MNVMVTNLYDALLSAGADEAKARRAAEELAPADLGLEPRVARLESDVAHIKNDVLEMKIDIRGIRSDIGDLRSEQGGIKERLARLETKVDHLPSKGFTVTSVLVTLAVMSALILFQERIKAFVAVPTAATTQATP